MNVVIRRADTKVVPVVPMSAVQESSEGKFVLVVDPQNKIEQRPIKASLQVGQNWSIDEGLKPGETIVIDGLQKVRPGIAVQAVPASRPTAQK